MSKKKKDEQAESIKEHREADARMLRERYLAVIELYTDPQTSKAKGNAQEIKCLLEACKNLSKLHHLLQPDKITQKVQETAAEKKEEKLSKEEESRIHDILNEQIQPKFS